MWNIALFKCALQFNFYNLVKNHKILNLFSETNKPFILAIITVYQPPGPRLFQLLRKKIVVVSSNIQNLFSSHRHLFDELQIVVWIPNEFLANCHRWELHFTTLINILMFKFRLKSDFEFLIHDEIRLLTLAHHELLKLLITIARWLEYDNDSILVR